MLFHSKGLSAVVSIMTVQDAHPPPEPAPSAAGAFFFRLLISFGDESRPGPPEQGPPFFLETICFLMPLCLSSAN